MVDDTRIEDYTSKINNKHHSIGMTFHFNGLNRKKKQIPKSSHRSRLSYDRDLLSRCETELCYL